MSAPVQERLHQKTMKAPHQGRISWVLAHPSSSQTTGPLPWLKVRWQIPMLGASKNSVESVHTQGKQLLVFLPLLPGWGREEMLWLRGEDRQRNWLKENATAVVRRHDSTWLQSPQTQGNTSKWDERWIISNLSWEGNRLSLSRN